MRIKIFIVLCFVVALLSYCNEKKELRDILSGDCYWDILDKGSVHPINSCYKFKEDGTCSFYYYNFFDKKKTDSVYLYDDGDVIVPNKWNLIKDSIQIRANKYYLIRYNPDSVFLTATGTDTMVLIKNCATFNPKDK
jgi:hypothetical protein